MRLLIGPSPTSEFIETTLKSKLLKSPRPASLVGSEVRRGCELEYAHPARGRSDLGDRAVGKTVPET
jgi:hypothetical protein